MNSTCIIDGQVFQSKAWDRGMGKYSLALIGALSKRRHYQSVTVLFTKALPLDKRVESAIKSAIPDARFIFLNLKVPGEIIQRSITPIMTQNTKILDDWATSSKLGDYDFIILSLFIDEVCSVFPTTASRRVLLFYDLIPLQYYERYGQFANYDNYLRRFQVILAADIIWTISQTVADDLMMYVGISKDKIYNINGAPIKRKMQDSAKPQGLNIPNRYLIMPSGDDPRKNNERAVRAVQKYNQDHDEKISVVITSFFTDGARAALQRICPTAIFTGNVSEGELRWLYENAEALIFVPEYEGLGLPILEAAEVDIPVVCSDLTVFEEMSTTAFYSAEWSSPESMAIAIEQALSRKDWEKKKAEYEGILKRYSWEETAKDAINALTTHLMTVRSDKRKIAIFTPDPSGYSAIGKFNILLHPALSEYFEIDYYIEKSRSGMNDVRPSYLSAIAKVDDASNFSAKKYKDYEAVVYHVGNSEFHIETVRNALYLPGYAIFHDTNLEGLFKRVLQKDGYMSDARVEVEEKINKLLETNFASYVGSLVNAQLGIITHTKAGTKELSTKVRQDSTIIHDTLALPVGTPVLRRHHGEVIKIAFAGIIATSKGLELIDQISNSDSLKKAQIYIFGIPFISEPELQRLRGLRNVTLLTNLSDFEFQSKLAEMDVLVNYRSEYHGEASASTLEAMRLGVVPIVRNIGWFSELNKNAVVHTNSHEAVLKAIVALNDDRPKLDKMSQAAMAETANHFNYKSYAKSLSGILNRKINSDSKNLRISKLFHQAVDKATIRRELQK